MRISIDLTEADLNSLSMAIDDSVKARGVGFVRPAFVLLTKFEVALSEAQAAAQPAPVEPLEENDGE